MYAVDLSFLIWCDIGGCDTEKNSRSAYNNIQSMTEHEKKSYLYCTQTTFCDLTDIL